MALKAVIFDFDMTLVALQVDWPKTIAEMEKILPAKCKDITSREERRNYFNDANLNYRRWSKPRQKRFLALLRKIEVEGAKKSKVLPMARGAVKRLSKHYGLGVVSSNSIHAVRAGLKRHGLQKYFRVVIGRENARRTKPAPDAILSAAKALGAKPGESAYVGDHHSDIVAGKAARVKTIAVTSSTTSASEFANYKPDAIIMNIGELDIALKGL